MLGERGDVAERDLRRKGPRRNAGLEAFWRRIVAGHPTSGRTVRDWCAAEGVSEPSFYAWRKELARRDASTRDRRPQGVGQRFVEVRVDTTRQGTTSNAAHSAAAIRLFVGDVRIEVSDDFEPSALRRVLDVALNVSRAENGPC